MTIHEGGSICCGNSCGSKVGCAAGRQFRFVSSRARRLWLRRDRACWSILNSLPEALDLEHRYYNASLLSFDDLIGFPYPTPRKRA